MTENRTKLTSAEITSIWSDYMNDSMSKCILGYLLKDVEDEEIRSIVQICVCPFICPFRKAYSFISRRATSIANRI